jgi:hypothetical protein
MSILKKGILGCPRGRMANIQCYRRKGVDIIQRPSTPQNSKNRLFNLYNKFFINLLTSQYAFIDATSKSEFQKLAGVSNSAFEYYLNYNLNVFRKELTFNCNKMLWSPSALTPAVPYLLSYDSATRRIKFSYNTNDSLDPAFNPSKVFFQNVRKAQSIQTIAVYPITQGTNSFDFIANQNSVINSLGVMANLFQFSPFKRSQLVLSTTAKFEVPG